jgi:hypothetical protein
LHKHKRTLSKNSLNECVFAAAHRAGKTHYYSAMYESALLSNEARAASRLRDMTERVTASKGKYRGVLPRKRAVGAGSGALPWGEYLLFAEMNMVVYMVNAKAMVPVAA